MKISLDSAITGINPHYLFNFWPTLKKKRATNRRHTFLIRIMLAQTIFFVTLSTTNPTNPTFTKYFDHLAPQPNSHTYFQIIPKLFTKSDHSKKIFRKQMEVLSAEFCCKISTFGDMVWMVFRESLNIFSNRALKDKEDRSLVRPCNKKLSNP